MLKVTDNSNEQEKSSIECFRCGICCSKYQVRMSLVEAKRIAAELGIPWKEFIANYTDQRWPGAESFLLRHEHGACIFLKHDKIEKMTGCLIYPFRPSSCQEWRPSPHRAECQEGLHKYWGIKISLDGKLKGNRTTIRRFQTFLKSLK